LENRKREYPVFVKKIEDRKGIAKEGGDEKSKKGNAAHNLANREGERCAHNGLRRTLWVCEQNFGGKKGKLGKKKEAKIEGTLQKFHDKSERSELGLHRKKMGKGPFKNRCFNLPSLRDTFLRGRANKRKEKSLR